MNFLARVAREDRDLRVGSRPGSVCPVPAYPLRRLPGNPVAPNSIESTLESPTDAIVCLRDSALQNHLREWRPEDISYPNNLNDRSSTIDCLK